jgi:hypothetical protein
LSKAFPLNFKPSTLNFLSFSGAKVVKITQKAQEIEQKMIEMLRE